MNEMKIGFEMERRRIALADILPVRKVKESEAHNRNYRKIRNSLKEVGLVEPLVVYPQRGATGKYLLLEGHLRYFALKELGETEAECILSTDDESFTYNARVNRLNAIAEHKMIVKAIQNGVRPERIAAALNIPLSQVTASATLLEGVNAEASDLLKDKSVSANTLRLLKKVNGVRQIEIAELMVTANTYTKSYVEALILSTPKDQLVCPEEPKKKLGLTPEEIGRMQEEMESVQRDLRAVEQNYGENMLSLTLARGYVKKLLENGKVVRYLNSNHGDLLTEFERIAATETV